MWKWQQRKDEEAREAENRTGQEEPCSTEDKQDRGTDTEVSRVLFMISMTML